MLCRTIAVVAAALLWTAAACDGDPGFVPDTMTTDTRSDTGKGDDPNPPDTYSPDSDWETDNGTTNPDIVVYTAQDLCPDLLAMEGTWYTDTYKDAVLYARIEIERSACVLRVECSKLLTIPLAFERTGPPPLFYDTTTGGVKERSKIYMEGSNLILEIYDDGMETPYMRVVFHK